MQDFTTGPSKLVYITASVHSSTVSQSGFFSFFTTFSATHILTSQEAYIPLSTIYLCCCGCGCCCCCCLTSEEAYIHLSTVYLCCCCGCCCLTSLEVDISLSTVYLCCCCCCCCCCSCCCLTSQQAYPLVNSFSSLLLLLSHQPASISSCQQLPFVVVSPGTKHILLSTVSVCCCCCLTTQQAYPLVNSFRLLLLLLSHQPTGISSCQQFPFVVVVVSPANRHIPL